MTDHQYLLETALEAARKAGKYQSLRRRGGFSTFHKGTIDLVTDVDRESERIVIGLIRERFPDDRILAEESGGVFGSGGRRWIVDPIDGTTNFAHGFPWFCVSIACEEEGELVCGVVHAPAAGLTFHAVRGKGAWLGNERIRVSDRSTMIESLLATGFPYDRSPDNENNLDLFCRFQLTCRGVRRAGSAALDLASVAAGWFDGFWECKLKPWDVAAGVLLVREAGGMVTSYDGTPYVLDQHRIVASNGLIHGEMIRLIGSVSGEGPASP